MACATSRSDLGVSFFVSFGSVVSSVVVFSGSFFIPCVGEGLLRFFQSDSTASSSSIAENLPPCFFLGGASSAFFGSSTFLGSAFSSFSDSASGSSSFPFLASGSAFLFSSSAK